MAKSVSFGCVEVRQFRGGSLRKKGNIVYMTLPCEVGGEVVIFNNYTEDITVEATGSQRAPFIIEGGQSGTIEIDFTKTIHQRTFSVELVGDVVFKFEGLCKGDDVYSDEEDPCEEDFIDGEEIDDEDELNRFRADWIRCFGVDD